MSNIFKFLHGDRFIWLVVFLLIAFSMLGIYSSTSTLAFRLQGGNTEYYLMKQFFYVMVGLLLMYVTHLVDYHYYSRLAQLFWFASIPLLIYTMFFGVEINNANRWIRVPWIGLTFQTSDFAKLALIMYLARLLSLKQSIITDFKEAFLPLLIPTLITVFLIAPDNLSTALIILLSSIFVMFIGRITIKHLAILSGISVVALGIFLLTLFIIPDSMHVKRTLTWKNRIENFFKGSENHEEDYQVLQAKIAIAKGGILNINPGGSHQKNFLPHPYSDFIYAIIIEEYGLIGGAIIVMLYLFFLYRCIRIVKQAPKAFGAFLAVGLGIALVIQAMINMAVAVNLIPVTGVTLPLVSMGGSSAIFTSIAFGIILSVSRNVELQSSPESV